MLQPQKDYISEAYKFYIENKKTDENTAKNLIDSYKLKVKEDQLPKFDLDLPLLKTQLLEKIEELTLYSIEQNKKIKEQNERIERLEKMLLELAPTPKK